jgi:hypothetical protein
LVCTAPTTGVYCHLPMLDYGLFWKYLNPINLIRHKKSTLNILLVEFLLILGVNWASGCFLVYGLCTAITTGTCVQVVMPIFAHKTLNY